MSDKAHPPETSPKSSILDQAAVSYREATAPTAKELDAIRKRVFAPSAPETSERSIGRGWWLGGLAAAATALVVALFLTRSTGTAPSRPPVAQEEHRPSPTPPPGPQPEPKIREPKLRPSSRFVLAVRDTRGFDAARGNKTLAAFRRAVTNCRVRGTFEVFTDTYGRVDRITGLPPGRGRCLLTAVSKVRVPSKGVRAGSDDEGPWLRLEVRRE